MKIACPKCGQHYDVEANALDHFFRCTECKTLFRGLNAKSVKLEKCKVKDSQDNTDSDELTAASPAADTASAVEISPDEVTDDKLVEDLHQKNNEDSCDQNRTQVLPPLPSELFQDTEEKDNTKNSQSSPVTAVVVTLPFAAAAIIIGLVALIFAFVCNARINDLQANNAALAAQSKEAIVALEKSSKQQEITDGEIKRICLRLDMIEKNTSALSNKVNSADVASEINTLAEDLKDLKKRLDNLSKLDDIVEECRKKIEDLEKSRRSRHR